MHVLDYKPDARTNKPIAQLAIYALALTRLVQGLKLFDIKCAWFNEDEYCEIFRVRCSSNADLCLGRSKCRRKRRPTFQLMG